MKRLVPLLALVPLVISIDYSHKFVLPTLALLSLLSVRLLLAMSFRREPLYVPMLLFLLAPAALMWAISERREGRDFWEPLISIELGISAIGTLWLLNSGRVNRRHIPFMLAAVMLWSLCYLSGSSGGADHMQPYYSMFGLSKELTWILIVWSRKIIHVVFYSTLANLFFDYFARTTYSHSQNGSDVDPEHNDPLQLDYEERRLAVGVALNSAFIIAACDEWRQNMMPNREGSIRDVILDIGAASIWLWWRYLRTNSTNPTAPGSEHQT